VAWYGVDWLGEEWNELVWIAGLGRGGLTRKGMLERIDEVWHDPNHSRSRVMSDY